MVLPVITRRTVFGQRYLAVIGELGARLEGRLEIVPFEEALRRVAGAAPLERGHFYAVLGLEGDLNVRIVASGGPFLTLEEAVEAARRELARLGEEMVVEETRVARPPLHVARGIEAAKLYGIASALLGAVLRALERLPEWAEAVVTVERSVMPAKRSQYGGHYYAKRTWRPLARVLPAPVQVLATPEELYKAEVTRTTTYYIAKPEKKLLELQARERA